ncbi:hypothetical protein FB451DRAFT_1194254 [Mycena latifolia]|nr:hypothetical protein FB451DRAFT_1194254 [Mycena latifolia]
MAHASVARISEAPDIYISNDGWLHLMKERRRICWIPVGFRPVGRIRVLDSGNRIAFRSMIGMLVILELGRNNFARNPRVAVLVKIIEENWSKQEYLSHEGALALATKF